MRHGGKTPQMPPGAPQGSGLSLWAEPGRAYRLPAPRYSAVRGGTSLTLSNPNADVRGSRAKANSLKKAKST